jgi:hypothetical protein
VDEKFTFGLEKVMSWGGGAKAYDGWVAPEWQKVNRF